jgi:hypothetical protein
MIAGSIGHSAVGSGGGRVAGAVGSKVLVHDHAVAAAGRESHRLRDVHQVDHDPRGLRCPPRPVLHARVIDHPEPPENSSAVNPTRSVQKRR